MAYGTRDPLKDRVVFLFDTGLADTRSRREMPVKRTFEIGRGERTDITKKVGRQFVRGIDPLGHHLDEEPGKAVEIHIDPAHLGHGQTGLERNRHVGGRTSSSRIRDLFRDCPETPRSSASQASSLRASLTS